MAGRLMIPHLSDGMRNISGAMVRLQERRGKECNCGQESTVSVIVPTSSEFGSQLAQITNRVIQWESQSLLVCDTMDNNRCGE